MSDKGIPITVCFRRPTSDGDYTNKCTGIITDVALENQRKTTQFDTGFVKLVRAIRNPSQQFIKALDHPSKKKRRARKKRIDGIDSILRVGEALFLSFQLECLRVGFSTHGGFKSLTIEAIASNADVPESTTKRALQCLADAGCLEITRQYELKDGVYKGFASVRRLTYRFFNLLGFSKNWLDKFRKWKHDKLEARKWGRQFKRKAVISERNLKANDSGLAAAISRLTETIKKKSLVKQTE